MKILKDVITHLAGQCRITLQVPDMAISFQNAPKGVKYDELPDEWFVYLKGTGQRPAVGKESGFLFLTRAGWEANKDAMQAAFEKGKAGRWDRGETWDDFVKHAEIDLASRKKSNAKFRKELKAKLDQLNKIDID